MNKKNTRILAILVGILILAILFVVQRNRSIQPTERPETPSLESLNQSIEKAQDYYEGLYQDLGDNGAVILEYYSEPQSVYTLRHATIGGYYYYSEIGDATRSGQLKMFIENSGFEPGLDAHSVIWTRTNNIPDNYFHTVGSYSDCAVDLPELDSVFPYHSKVCKLGVVGIRGFIFVSRFDPFIKTVDMLQILGTDEGVLVSDVEDLEGRFDRLGFGIAMCSPFGCSSAASAFRTALFGELELRMGDMEYADAVAGSLVAAQNDQGAIYLSYDGDGEYKMNKPLAYKVVDRLLGDTPVYDGFVATNAESMSDTLAFLMHYRCERHEVCN